MTFSRRALVAVFLLALTCVPGDGHARTQNVAASPVDLLKYYAAGEFDAVGKALRGPHLRSRAGILDSLKHRAHQWIDALPDRRRSPVTRPVEAVAGDVALNQRVATAAIVMVSAALGVAQRQTFRARADLVTVQVAVETGSTPVTDLTARDFDVSDNGVPQQVDLIEAGGIPIDVSIVLDTSGSMARSVEGLKSDTRAIATMLHPDDRLRVITFSSDATEAFGFQSPDADLDVSHVAAVGSTALFEAVALAMMTPREPDRRHLVVVLTDGGDNSSILGSGTALDNLSKRTDAVLYAAVSARARVTSGVEKERARRFSTTGP